SANSARRRGCSPPRCRLGRRAVRRRPRRRHEASAHWVGHGVLPLRRAYDVAGRERSARSERRDVLLLGPFPGIGFGLDDGSDGFGFDGVPVAEWAGPVEPSWSVWVLGDGPAGEGLQQMAYLVEAAQVGVRGGPAVAVRGGVIDLAGVRGACTPREGALAIA